MLHLPPPPLSPREKMGWFLQKDMLKSKSLHVRQIPYISEPAATSNISHNEDHPRASNLIVGASILSINKGSSDNQKRLWT